MDKVEKGKVKGPIKEEVNNGQCVVKEWKMKEGLILPKKTSNKIYQETGWREMLRKGKVGIKNNIKLIGPEKGQIRIPSIEQSMERN